VLLENFGGKLRYSVPIADVSLSKLFGEIQKVRGADKLDIRDYSISQTTLEQVFIAFARGQRDDGQS